MPRISPALRLVMLAGAAVSLFGWLSADILSTPRMLFAFARDGWLPSQLGRVHGRTNVTGNSAAFFFLRPGSGQ